MISSEYYMLIYLNFATKNTITQKSTQQTTFSYLISKHTFKHFSQPPKEKKRRERAKKTYKAIIINSENILLIGDKKGKGTTS